MSKTTYSGVRIPPPPIAFPPAWLWLVDEAIPEHVKRVYSPKESWKNKPFSREDARFFFKGVSELSELFTEERPRNIPTYFAHPRFRSAYLLYFLPLQAAKFISLFELHHPALEAALAHARMQARDGGPGILRVADLGAGPGTASLALLLWLLAYKPGTELPRIELHWVDTQRNILEDGAELARRLASHFPRLRNKVEIKVQIATWTKALPPSETSLVLMGHLLNESHTQLPAPWRTLISQASGGGILVVEPATKRSAQNLSSLRDAVLASAEEASHSHTPGRLWGPCLHTGACPLAYGRDWCHFSFPIKVSGTWFRELSKGLGSERNWLKLSYLWLASPNYPAPSTDDKHVRLVVSDPIRPPGPTSERTRARQTADVLLCEPSAPKKLTLPPDSLIRRGDRIRLGKK